MRPFQKNRPGENPLLYRYAQLTAGAVVFLLVAGALVTSTGSGLAVPDWPLSYGQVMPPMVGGVLYEHGHRMVATFVGVLTVVLAVWVWRAETRPWLRRLTWGALGLVILQGVLGGVTVLLKLPVLTSAAHGCIAQAFFMVIVFIALALSPGWNAPGRPSAGLPRGVVQAASVATGVVYAQLVLGAVMRHMNAGLAIPDFPLAFGRLVPPQFTPEIAIHWAHRLGALVVAVAVGTAAWRTLRTTAEASLRRPAMYAVLLLLVQVSLGASIIWTHRAVWAATAHVVVGALLLASCLVWSARGIRARGNEPASARVSESEGLRYGEVTA